MCISEKVDNTFRALKKEVHYIKYLLCDGIYEGIEIGKYRNNSSDTTLYRGFMY